eukprot:GILK01002930.1.p1 GENE.GILK01002930.1~~GILK01002930.1.p1  ORF type:complete len:517 (+),score=41.64 GILK01002930.1:210-1553(+)
MGEGAEMLVLSLLNNLLTKEWDLTATSRGLLGSSVFFGFLLGSIGAGPASDKYGRRIILLIGITCLFVFSLSSAFAPNFGVLLVFRSFLGVSMGIVSPVSATLVTELLPIRRRGAILVLFGAFFTIGEMLAALITWLVMPQFEPGQWRLLLAVISVPAALSLIACFLFAPESPRFLAISGQQEELHAILRRMARVNNVPAPTADELRRCTVIVKESRGSVANLWTRYLRRTTGLLWLIWFVQSLVFYGLVYILPSTFLHLGAASEDKSDVIVQVLISAAAELPSTIATAITVELPYIGRRHSMTFCMFGCSVSCLLCAVVPSSFVVWAALAKNMINGSFCVIYPYTLEVYPTSDRTTGIGSGSACSRIGGIMTPFVSEALADSNVFAPYIFFSVFALVGSLASCLLPYDTIGNCLPFEDGDSEVLLTSTDHLSNKRPGIQHGAKRYE